LRALTGAWRSRMRPGEASAITQARVVVEVDLAA
jgi:hypothetical protein